MYVFLTFLLIIIPFFEVHVKLNERYNRKKWKHWIDANRDCQNTRNEVLIRDSLLPVRFYSRKKCRVKSGKWKCFYTNRIFTNPRLLDIDHVVPLAEAYRSGGYLWKGPKKKQFANDLSNKYHLLAVYRRVNRAKRDKDPALWLPDNNKCEYIKYWRAIKAKYQLSIDEKEKRAINNVLTTCSNK